MNNNIIVKLKNHFTEGGWARHIGYKNEFRIVFWNPIIKFSKLTRISEFDKNLKIQKTSILLSIQMESISNFNLECDLQN